METIINVLIFFPVIPFFVGVAILHNIKTTLLFVAPFISINLYALLQYLIPNSMAGMIIVSLHIVLISLILFKHRKNRRFGIETIIKEFLRSVTVYGSMLHFVLLGACIIAYISN